MRVLVCGGRDYENSPFFFRFMDSLHDKRPVTHIIEGGAKGADHMALNWAKSMEIPQTQFPANWNDTETEPVAVKTNSYGKPYNALAGFVRNQRMIDEGKPDLCVAFPGGNGTRDMIDRCRKAGIKVIELNR